MNLRLKSCDDNIALRSYSARLDATSLHFGFLVPKII